MRLRTSKASNQSSEQFLIALLEIKEKIHIASAPGFYGALYAFFIIGIHPDNHILQTRQAFSSAPRAQEQFSVLALDQPISD